MDSVYRTRKVVSCSLTTLSRSNSHQERQLYHDINLLQAYPVSLTAEKLRRFQNCRYTTKNVCSVPPVSCSSVSSCDNGWRSTGFTITIKSTKIEKGKYSDHLIDRDSTIFFFMLDRLVQMEVVSLDDVYWVEDHAARTVLGKDLSRWTQARQELPTSKEDLATLKADLWSSVVKNSQHQDAWTWGSLFVYIINLIPVLFIISISCIYLLSLKIQGGMLVVSVSVAGLVTLAAMTQPALAPEAKHSLLQYVTGKYLLPSNCRVHFQWEEPQLVGETMTFTVKVSRSKQTIDKKKIYINRLYFSFISATVSLIPFAIRIIWSWRWSKEPEESPP